MGAHAKSGPDMSSDSTRLAGDDAIQDLNPPELAQQMYDAAGEAAQLLRAIGSEHRLMILCELMEGERTVTEICQSIGARQSLVSQHLTRLRLDGLVRATRQSHFSYYSISNPVAREIVGVLYRHFCTTGRISPKS